MKEFILGIILGFCGSASAVKTVIMTRHLPKTLGAWQYGTAIQGSGGTSKLNELCQTNDAACQAYISTLYLDPVDELAGNYETSAIDMQKAWSAKLVVAGQVTNETFTEVWSSTAPRTQLTAASFADLKVDEIPPGRRVQWLTERPATWTSIAAPLTSEDKMRLTNTCADALTIFSAAGLPIVAQNCQHAGDDQEFVQRMGGVCKIAGLFQSVRAQGKDVPPLDPDYIRFLNAYGEEQIDNALDRANNLCCAYYNLFLSTAESKPVMDEWIKSNGGKDVVTDLVDHLAVDDTNGYRLLATHDVVINLVRHHLNISWSVELPEVYKDGQKILDSVTATNLLPFATQLIHKSDASWSVIVPKLAFFSKADTKALFDVTVHIGGGPQQTELRRPKPASMLSARVRKLAEDGREMEAGAPLDADGAAAVVVL